MKRVLIIYLCILMTMLTACYYNKPSEISDENELVSSHETTAMSTNDNSNDGFESSSVPETVISTPNLILTEPDEWNFNSREKDILLAEKGYYYYVENYDMDAPHRILVLDDRNGNITKQLAADGFIGSYLLENTIYGYQWDVGICKYENGVTTLLNEKTYGDFGTLSYYTSDYIYFCPSGTDIPALYKMDYSGENVDLVTYFGDNSHKIYDFVVYDEKVWYSYINTMGNVIQKFAVYDFTTKQTTELDYGGVGLINNGFMYYTDTKNTLFRLDLKTYYSEPVCQEVVEKFDFYENYIIYSTGDSLYKLDTNENLMIFSAEDFFDTEYDYEISGIQCQSNRIFITISSGAFDSWLLEIDSNGSLVEKIHGD